MKEGYGRLIGMVKYLREKPKIPKSELIRLYIKEKLTYGEIFNKLDITRKELWSLLYFYGIPRRKANKIIPFKGFEEELKYLYWIKGIPLGEISAGIGIAKTSFWRYLINIRFPLRTIKMASKVRENRIREERPEANINRSEALKKLNEDPNFKKSQEVENKRKPSKLEKKFIRFFADYFINEKIKYVGNGKLWIGHKNPDFVVEGTNNIIEIFGFVHSKDWSKITGENIENEEDRVRHFKKYKYNCLIIWGFEIKDQKTLKRKVNNFLNEARNY